MLRVGDRVVVKKPGKTYSMYTYMAKLMNLKYFKRGDAPQDFEWFNKNCKSRVVAVKPHGWRSATCVGIRFSNKGVYHDFIVEASGLEKKESSLMSSIDETLFEI